MTLLVSHEEHALSSNFSSAKKSLLLENVGSVPFTHRAVVVVIINIHSILTKVTIS